MSKAIKQAVQDGLTSTNTYVVLHHNPRAGMHLAIRPHVSRIDDNTVWLGGRLRCAWDFESRGVCADRKAKYADADYETLADLIRKEYPGLDWMTRSNQRSSTTVGICLAVGTGDEKAFKAMWDETDFVGALLDEIQSKVGKKLLGVRSVGGKKIMMEELWKRYGSLIKQVFYTGGTSLPEEVLGEISPLINQGQKRGNWSHKRDQFRKQIEKEIATASA